MNSQSRMKSGSRGAAMDAIALLKKDHEKLRQLLSQLEKTTERSLKKREDLLSQIETDVKIHTTIEEEIFYPAYRDAVRSKSDKEHYFEALEEHHVVDLVMPEIKDTEVDAENFSAKAKVLKDLIEHHAEEEEKMMFPKARKAMGAAQLRDLGEQMDQRKADLQTGFMTRTAQRAGDKMRSWVGQGRKDEEAA